MHDYPIEDYNSIRLRLGDMEHENRELRTQLAACQEQVKRLEKELAASQKRNQQRRRKCGILKRANARLAKGIAWSKSELAVSRQQLQQAREDSDLKRKALVLIENVVSDDFKEGQNGVDLIAAERKRQIDVEGWTAEHDSQFFAGILARAGAAYATSVALKDDRLAMELWPFDLEWWKPTPDDPVRQLVKAGALVAAEIDRLRAKESQND